jgi:hypothetical protein
MGIRRRYYVLAALLVLVTAAALSFRRNDPMVWHRGDRQSYSINSFSVMQSASADVQKMNQMLEISGTLNMRVCEIRGGTAVAAFQFSPLSVKLSGKESESLEKSASSVFFAEISSEGKFLKFVFDGRTIAADDARAVQDILKSAEFVVRKYSLFKRAGDESDDAAGTYAVSYSYGDEVSKTKKSYAPSRVKGQRVEIKRSAGKARYDGAHSWLSNAEYGEFVVYYSGEKAMLKVSSRMKLSIVETSTAPLDIWNDDLNYGMIALWKDTVSNPGGEVTKSMSSGISLDEFKHKAAAIMRESSSYNGARLSELIDLLSRCPEAADLVPSLVMGNKYPVSARLMLVYALGRSGVEGAERNLVLIMGMPSTGMETRIQAVVGIGSLQAISKNTENTLWLAFKGRENAEFRNAAVLALGAFAKEGEGDAPAGIKKRIRQEYSSASGIGDKTALLLSAGNTSDPDMIPLIKDGLADGNSHVRSAAAGALHYMDDKKSNGILVDQLAGESDSNVRKSIVSTMYNKGADESTTGAVFSALKKENSETVRSEMYRYLLKNRNVDGVKDGLRSLLSAETSSTNRNMILTALLTEKK